MLAANMKYGYSLKAIAGHLGIHYSKVGKTIKKLGETDISRPDP
jgi:DNA-binding MarR family transcriptional regulator